MGKTIEKMFDEKQQRITKAIAQKERSIAYFNSVNAAIQMAIAGKSISGGEKKHTEMIQEWRDWFFNEWINWYLENIAQEGQELSSAQKKTILGDSKKSQEMWDKKHQEIYDENSEKEEIEKEYEKNKTL